MSFEARRVLTIGTFDLLHAGHVRLFERAAEYGELTVGVNSDRFVATYKRLELAQGFDERLDAVAGCDMVARALENDGPGRHLILDERPDLLVIGHDWHGRDYPAQIGITADELADAGVAVLYLPRTPDISSGLLRRERGMPA